MRKSGSGASDSRSVRAGEDKECPIPGASACQQKNIRFREHSIGDASMLED